MTFSRVSVAAYTTEPDHFLCMLNITETWSCMFPPEIRRHVISSCGLTHMIARHKIYVHWWLKSHRGFFSSGQSLSYAIEKLKKDSKQQDSNLRVTIYNGNRTEWSPVLSVIIKAICQLRVWLQTELDDTKSCFQLIITITISEKKIHLGQTFSSRENVWSKKFGSFPVFFSG